MTDTELVQKIKREISDENREPVLRFGLEPGEILSVKSLPESKHIFSHIEWHMIGYWVKINRNLPKDYIAAKKEELKTIYPLPNAFGRYTKLIK